MRVMFSDRPGEAHAKRVPKTMLGFEHNQAKVGVAAPYLISSKAEGVGDMWIHTAFGAIAILLVFLHASPATAGCKDPAAEGVDWHGCNMQVVMLHDADLARANLEGAFLSGTAFSGARLSQANLHRAELVRTTFEGADLSGANLEKALAARAVFNGAVLKNARLVKAEFHRVTFDGADLSGSDMSEGDFIRNSFADANLSGAIMVGATLPRSVFHGANLNGVSMQRAYLYWARFEGTDLSGIKDLTQEQLNTTCGDQTTKLPQGLTVPKSWPCPAD